jgi:hypothetical protein
MYTDELIKEVKELYPDNKMMHELAETGNSFLGQYLQDPGGIGFTNDDILNAGSLEQLKERAMISKRKKQLYDKWFDENVRQG